MGHMSDKLTPYSMQNNSDSSARKSGLVFSSGSNILHNIFLKNFEYSNFSIINSSSIYQVLGLFKPDRSWRLAMARNVSPSEYISYKCQLHIVSDMNLTLPESRPDSEEAS